MKNFIKYISLACASIFALSACNDDEDIIKLDPSNFVAPKVETPASSTIELLEENAANTAMTFNWSAANYGTNTPPKYELQIDVKGDNFENHQVLTSTSTLTADVTVKELNLAVIALGLEPFKEGEIEYRIVSTVGTPGSQQLISNVNILKITPYPTDLSTNWGVVGSATPNGWDGPDVQFWKTDVTNVFVAYTDLKAGEIKFRQDNKWELDYGGSNGKLEKGGKNIAVDAGTYKITMDLTNLTYKLDNYSWGLVGDATANGWDGPDQKLSYDGTLDAWTITTTLKDGEFKFRLNNDWGTNFGGTSNAGELTDKDGTNIKIKAGKYKITANFNKKTYTVEAQ
ncbi:MULTISPECIES: SusE domain-containing protein [Empedobacter]|uniref:SusF/SusE family outer membrane protein n=1 Tax=Empedobacter falsenii TaxID=343874 RepID=A0A3R8SMQ8_9FLAO|nr:MULTISPECIES: SusE domain-containing protein [Empedobacter]MBW1617400.1 SusF/SusE family outer membrane protein [Empedobacter falsenii]MDM1137945.1 SusE domain-containing protein [Empedobacter sp. R132-2]RRT92720.1 SusF/SusE family outer membrane protein [Empedobacter falsenii]RRT92754.1 SusF/SusE family outer membrane protein [Empedobacter falsenii]